MCTHAIFIVVYPGHKQGYEESLWIDEYVSSLDSHKYNVSMFKMLNKNNAPYVIEIEKRATESKVNWPVTIAPFDVHICPLDYTKKENIKEITDKVYTNLQSLGLDVLLDDRNKSAGVKFADSDLIGAPIRIVVSERNLQNNVFEVKVSGKDESEFVNVDEISTFVTNTLNKLREEM